MNKGIVIFIFILLTGYFTPGFAESKRLGRVLISFDFNRAERDFANNQFAVWIEDMDEKLIKTLFATKFTATGGWRYRAESLPEWTQKSDISNMNEKEVDAVSGATPKAQRLVYTWKGDNINNEFLTAGEYAYCVEANYYWDTTVVYRGSIHLGAQKNNNNAKVIFSSAEAEKFNLIENVSALFIPK